MNRKQEVAKNLENELFHAIEDIARWEKRLVSSNYLNNYAAVKLQEAKHRKDMVTISLQEVWSIENEDEVYRIWQHLKKRYPEMTNLDAARLVGRRLEQKQERKLP